MNWLERLTGVKAKACFYYNSAIVFAVPKSLMTKAIGKDAANIKKLALKLKHKIKIVAVPTSRADLAGFIRSITFPHTIKNICLENNKLIIYTSQKSKALLIGKGKAKLRELAEILERFFEIKEIQIR